MIFWIIQMGEPIAGIDGDVRDFRYTLLAKELASRGHEVVRWTSTFSHVFRKFRFTQNKTVELFPHLRVRLLHGEPAYYNNISWARLRQQRAVARLFKSEAESWPRPDLIYAGIPVPEWAENAVDFGRRYNIPVIVDAQDQWPDIYVTAFPRPLHAFVRLLLNHEFNRSRKIFRNATGITAVSQTYFDWAINRAGRSPCSADGVFPLGYVVPPFAEAPNKLEQLELRKKLNIPPTAKVVSFLGTFGASYDIVTMVQASVLLQKQQREKVHLVMAGDGDKMALARSMASGVSTITIPGWVDQRTARTLNALSSIGLCAYSPKAIQSISYKPLEYMAAGLPLISSLRGELRAIIEAERCGVYYVAGDAGSLCGQILRLAADQQESRQMGLRARALFEKRYDGRQIYPQLAEQLEITAKGARDSV